MISVCVCINRTYGSHLEGVGGGGGGDPRLVPSHAM